MALYLQDARYIKDDVARFLISPPEDTSGPGREVPEELAALGEVKYALRQLWTLVKMLKTARRSCRNNAALNTYLKAVFPWAEFRQVPKVNAKGEKYMGLAIVVRHDGSEHGYQGEPEEQDGGE